MSNAKCQIEMQMQSAENSSFIRHSAFGIRHCSGRIWTTLIIVLTTIGVIFLVCLKYLPRAVDAWNHTDVPGRKLLGAVTLLLAGVLLFFLLVMLWLAIRYARPRKPAGKTVTKYIDAWAESGKRMETPPKEDEEQN